jgi:hypothetical protein
MRRARTGAAAAAAGALLVVVPLAAPPALFARQALTMPDFTRIEAPRAALVPLQRGHPAGLPGQDTISLSRPGPAVTAAHPAPGRGAAGHRAASHRAASHRAASHRAAGHGTDDRRVAHLAQQGGFPAVLVLAGLGTLLFAPLALAGAAMLFRRRTAGGSPPGP